jgi:hypothetical protein
LTYLNSDRELQTKQEKSWQRSSARADQAAHARIGGQDAPVRSRQIPSEQGIFRDLTGKFRKHYFARADRPD